MYKNIKIDVSEQLALITLNNPEKLNTLSKTTVDELYDAVTCVATDQNILALLMWGGEKLFGAGADIGDVLNQAGTSVDGYKFSRRLHGLFDKIEKMQKPTIAAIGGYALGGCLEMALAFDIRIASENAKLGVPEVTLGVIPGGGGTQRLPRLIGTSRAKEITFSGKSINAEEAFRIGLVNHVVKEGTLLDESMKMAREFTKVAPLALSMAKTAIDISLDVDLNAGLEHEAKCFGLLFDTEDLKEGTDAFTQKRQPVFMGK